MDLNKLKKWMPKKILWYFPIILKSKRMFQLPKTVENLTLHENKRTRDGKLCHSADSLAWQLIDNKWPDFPQEPRNLQLTLSSNGINPYSTLNMTYSCWLVTLITYNLSLLLCMKRKFMMLSVLIYVLAFMYSQC